MNLKTRSVVVLASVLVAGAAGAQSFVPQSGFLRLLNATDTIALSGSVPLGTSYTIEARIRYWGLPNPTAGIWPDAARLWICNRNGDGVGAFGTLIPKRVARHLLGQANCIDQ